MNTLSSFSSETSSSSEDGDILGYLRYQEPKNAKKGDLYISDIQVEIESDSPIEEPGVEFRLVGGLSLAKAKYRSRYHNYIPYTKIDLDSRSIVYSDRGSNAHKAGEKIDAINIEQVIEDVECLLIG